MTPRRPLRVVSAAPSPPVASSWVEVEVRWAGDVLTVAHVAPHEPYLLAEELPPGFRGYVLPGSGPVQVARREGRTELTLPLAASRARFYVDKAAYGREAALRHRVLRRDGDTLTFTLGPRSSCRFGLGRFEIAVAAVDLPAIPVLPGEPARERRRRWLLLASLVVNLALVGAILAVR